VAALAVLVTKPSSSASTFPTPAPCTSADLTAPYHGVDSVTSFGCVGDYAYLWATVGTPPAEASVTELLYYDPTQSAWVNALRANYCGSGVLPVIIQERACNSN
jgi:hypothetical protein